MIQDVNAYMAKLEAVKIANSGPYPTDGGHMAGVIERVVTNGIGYINRDGHATSPDYADFGNHLSGVEDQTKPSGQRDFLRIGKPRHRGAGAVRGP